MAQEAESRVEYLAEAEAQHKILTMVQASLEEIEAVMALFYHVFEGHVSKTIAKWVADLELNTQTKPIY